ncbi:MAG: sigma-70 family RNA polymerase sigma factor [Propionibacteriaceae bacterium]|jgi:RNA polymerase sigma-70 factor (ECF subfamily)|nr:sigma-70 family RNA polymerase sigma factor [Propionibacteriaceae bacterium]
MDGSAAAGGLAAVGVYSDSDDTPLCVSARETRAVISRYESMVYAIALTHTKCRVDADDVFQETFLAYHRKHPDCRNEEHLKAWLIVATMNCAKRVVANSWRTRVVPLTAEHAADLPDVFSFKTDEQDAVFRALSDLPENYRTVLHLFYFEDLPVLRIAEILDLAAGAVKMRLSRGREMLRSQLTGGLFDE